MRKLLAAAAFCVSSVISTDAMTDVGLEPVSIDVSHHSRPVTGVVWLPVTGGEASLYADNPVFEGVPIRVGGTVREGAFPVILLSHGYGGNVRSVSWLGAGPAGRGAFVVSVNHPNSTTGDMNVRESLDHGARAEDLSAALDWLLERTELAKSVDASRVMSVGFSYGGWTALSLGGVRGDLDGYAEHCRAYRERSALCVEAMRATDDFSAIDRDMWNMSYRHPRVSHVAAIDPALHWGLEPDDLGDIAPNVLLIGLGEGDDRLLATDFSESGSGFAALLPGARVETLKPAAHFTALLLCKEQGASLLEEDGDDPVCTDPPGTDRAAIHAKIVDLIATEFGL